MKKALLILALFLSVGACCTVKPEPVTVEAEAEDFNRAFFIHQLNSLEELCPLNAPVRVRIGILEGVWGMTQWMPQGFYLISIDARQPLYSLINTLEHEWAHAMVWDTGDLNHGPFWGVAWAQCYRATLAAGQSFEPSDD